MQLTVSILLFVTFTRATFSLWLDDEKLVVDQKFLDRLKIIERKHDVVKIYASLKKLEPKYGVECNGNSKLTLFFVEADNNGYEVVDRGLYVKFENKIQKLLDHGRDIATSTDPSNKKRPAFFAAKDGIYVYDAKEMKAVKYGTVEKDLIGIAIGHTSQFMYVLSADKKVYEVTREGNRLERVDRITSAEQIVVDDKNNLFYIDSKNKVHIVNDDGVREVKGLPKNANKITLLKPPFDWGKGGIPVIANNKSYKIYPNGAVEETNMILKVDVSALSVESTLYQFYARENKIYQYNTLSDLGPSIKRYVGNLLDNIFRPFRH